jgi:hypothetical protein
MKPRLCFINVNSDKKQSELHGHHFAKSARNECNDIYSRVLHCADSPGFCNVGVDGGESGGMSGVAR